MALTDGQQEPRPQEPRKAPGAGLRKLLPFTTTGVIIAALYVAWTFYSRHQSDVEAERALAAKQQAQRERTVKAVFGSGEILFSTFSADAGVLKRGSHTELCYGVENATTVRIEPAIGDVRPSYRKCLDIAPQKTTTYKITAEDGKGHSKSESLTVQVH